MWITHCNRHVNVTFVCNGKWSYILDGSVDTDNLPGRLSGVDTDRGMFMTERNNFEATGAMVVSY